MNDDAPLFIAEGPYGDDEIWDFTNPDKPEKVVDMRWSMWVPREVQDALWARIESVIPRRDETVGDNA